MDNVVEFKEQKLLENVGGPRKSLVKVSVKLTKGRSNQIWSWEATVIVDRNDRVFNSSDHIIPDNKFQLLDCLFATVENDIKTRYSKGCNINAEEIVEFVEECKNVFYKQLETPTQTK